MELELDGDELTADIESASDFRDECRKQRLAAVRLLGVGDDDARSSTSSHSSTSPSLPKLELPSFSGDVLKWMGFWDQFSAVVDQSDLPEVSKFVYLQSLLTDDAKMSVKGLSLSEGNYAIAKDILKSRYGRKERIIFTHIQQLMSVSAPGTIKCDTSTLWKLQDELLANIRSLEAFGITGDQYGVILTPLILSRLPQDIRLEWARDGEGRESDLEWLLKFLANEIHRRERSQSFKDPAASVPASTCEERGRPVRKASASALHSSSTTTTSDGQVQCAVCNVKGHLAERCWDLSSLAMSERSSRVQQGGLCFRCLRKSHVAKGCDKCGGRHHVLLCGPRSTSTQHTEKGDPSYRSVSDNPKSVHTESKHTTSSLSLASSTVASSVEAHSKKVILQTAYVTVSGTGGRTDSVTVLFDTGSDRSYISSCSVKCVEPEWVGAQPIAYSAFGTTCGGKAEQRNLFQVNLKCADDNYVSLLATEIPTICAPVYRPEVPLHVLQSFEGLSLTVDRPGGDGNQIDILIGLDAYWKFMKAGIVRGPGGLVAQESVFGWVLSGSLYSELESSHETASHQLLCLNDISESAVQQFWNLDSIGICDAPVEVSDVVSEVFKQQITYDGGRYEVAFPWKPGMVDVLQDNEKLARARLESLCRKLDRDADLSCRYNSVLQDMENDGIIEEVPEDEIVSPHPTYYMPHRPVVKEGSSTTKVRPVFDASAPSRNGVSLNDCLETGPNLIPSLPEILIRFRRWKVAFTADITKAFLQIKIRESDRDVSRFLWKVHGCVRVMRFTRVPFGNKSSPFLLNATIKYHLDTYPASNSVVQELQENLYVDDLLTGADSDAEGCDMIREADAIMNGAGMTFSKWSSDSLAVTDMLYHQFWRSGS